MNVSRALDILHQLVYLLLQLFVNLASSMAWLTASSKAAISNAFFDYRLFVFSSFSPGMFLLLHVSHLSGQTSQFSSPISSSSAAWSSNFLFLSFLNVSFTPVSSSSHTSINSSLFRSKSTLVLNPFSIIELFSCICVLLNYSWITVSYPHGIPKKICLRSSGMGGVGDYEEE